MGPDLVERNFSSAIEFGADGRFVFVVRIDDDFLVAEVNFIQKKRKEILQLDLVNRGESIKPTKLVKIQSSHIDLSIKIDTSIATTADSEVGNNTASIVRNEINQRFQRRNSIVPTDIKSTI